jgi:hypothetical protein
MNEFFNSLFDFFLLLFILQAELTQSKSATEVIQRLKSSSERVQVSCCAAGGCDGHLTALRLTTRRELF